MPSRPQIKQRTIEAISADDRLLDALRRCAEYQEEHVDSDRWEGFDHTGFEASDVGCAGWELHQLAQTGIVSKVYDSNSSSAWRLCVYDDESDERVHIHGLAQTCVEAVASDQDANSDHSDASLDGVGADALFTDVVGRDEPKKWFRKTIRKQVQVHHLMHGPPGGGKSEILDDLLELPGAQRVVFSGNQSSAAGVVDTLLEHRPTVLVVEEIEKGSKKDREALMTLCGKGYVERTKADAQTDSRVELDTIVFAAGNDLEAITPDSLADRFMKWRFDAYTISEYRRVCKEVLPRETDVDAALAGSIAEEVHGTLGTTQVREAERVAALADDLDDVRMLVNSIAE